jgi:uncharacterized membrane protein YqaE (UPF0057 family)
MPLNIELIGVNTIGLNQGGFMGLIRILCSFLLPPLGVFLKVGFEPHFWINILLTLLGYFPGLIHALYVNIKD